eukprot:jgi/Pico_ML_1/50960/g2074.t1
MSRAKLVEEHDLELHYTFTTLIFRFVDDVNLLVCAGPILPQVTAEGTSVQAEPSAPSTSGTVQVRSVASRNDGVFDSFLRALPSLATNRRRGYDARSEARAARVAWETPCSASFDASGHRKRGTSCVLDESRASPDLCLFFSISLLRVTACDRIPFHHTLCSAPVPDQRTRGTRRPVGLHAEEIRLGFLPVVLSSFDPGFPSRSVAHDASDAAISATRGARACFFLGSHGHRGEQCGCAVPATRTSCVPTACNLVQHLLIAAKVSSWTASSGEMQTLGISMDRSAKKEKQEGPCQKDGQRSNEKMQEYDRKMENKEMTEEDLVV